MGEWSLGWDVESSTTTACYVVHAAAALGGGTTMCEGVGRHATPFGQMVSSNQPLRDLCALCVSKL